jgi:hypothetical protein
MTDIGFHIYSRWLDFKFNQRLFVVSGAIGIKKFWRDESYNSPLLTMFPLS